MNRRGRRTVGICGAAVLLGVQVDATAGPQPEDPKTEALPQASRIFEPADYELEMRTLYDRSVLKELSWQRALAAWEKSTDPRETRKNVRKAAELCRRIFQGTFGGLPNHRSYEQTHLLLLRRVDHWRLLTGGSPAQHDTYYNGSKVILSGKRAEDGYRVVTYEIPAGYFGFGPISALTALREVSGLLQRRQVAPRKKGSAVRWRLDLRDLTEKEYFALRLPPLFTGISRGSLTLTVAADRVVEACQDGTGALVIRRTLKLEGGAFAGWTEERWIPGSTKPFGRVEISIVSRQRKEQSDPVFAKGHFRKIKVVDRASGQARMVMKEEEGLPDDAEFERLYAQANRRARQKSGTALPLVAAGLALTVLGLYVMRRRSPATPTPR